MKAASFAFGARKRKRGKGGKGEGKSTPIRKKGAKIRSHLITRQTKTKEEKLAGQEDGHPLRFLSLANRSGTKEKKGSHLRHRR